MADMQSIEEKAIAEAVAIQARARAAYQDVLKKLDLAHTHITKLEHELDLTARARDALSAERDILVRQIAAFHTHVSTFYTHISDMTSAIAQSWVEAPDGRTVTDLKKLEDEIVKKAQNVRNKLFGAKRPKMENGGEPSVVVNPSPPTDPGLPGFLSQGPRVEES